MSDGNWQFILDDSGQKSFVVIPAERFKAMEKAAQEDHDFKQLAELLKIDDDENHELTPASVVHEIAEGMHPVRAWRKHRKLKAVELARQSGISPAYLSEIETGKKDGTFKTMAAIAVCLGVKLDDLAPSGNEAERAERLKRARRTALLNQIKQLRDMMGDDRPFDTAAVRQTSESLSKLAIEAGLDGDTDEDWLALVYDIANTMIEQVNNAERRLIDTASTTRRELVDKFADQLNSISNR